MNDTTDIAFMVADVLAMIDEDGLGGCRSFAELHDHVDANEYLQHAWEAAVANDDTIPTEGDEWLDLLNRIADRVDAKLAAR